QTYQLRMNCGYVRFQTDAMVHSGRSGGWLHSPIFWFKPAQTELESTDSCRSSWASTSERLTSSSMYADVELSSTSRRSSPFPQKLEKSKPLVLKHATCSAA